MPKENQTDSLEISNAQMWLFWKKVCEGSINREIFQAFLNNASAFTVPRGIYYNISEDQKKAAQIMGPNFIGLNMVINALQWKGISINLSEDDLAKYSSIPLSMESLRDITQKKWRNTRAILWWAPPERYGFNLKKLLDIFGTDNKYLPCFYNDKWWIKENFADHVITEGWHLNMVELAFETKGQTFSHQLNLMQDNEALCSPAELSFLSFINFIVNREYIFHDFYTRTSAKLLLDCTASVGKFTHNGFKINKISDSLKTQDTAIGVAFSRHCS